MRSSTGQSSENASRVRRGRKARDSRMDLRMRGLRAHSEFLQETYKRGAGLAAPHRCITCLPAGAQELNVPRGRAHLKRGSAAVQFAFRSKALWTRPIATLARHPDIVEVRRDFVAVGEIDAGADSHRYVRSDVNDDITRRSLQHRVGAFSSRGDELRQNAPRAGFRARRGYAVQLDPTRAGLSSHDSLRPAQANAAAPGLNLHRTGNVSQFNIASAGGNLQLAAAFLDFNVAATSLK